VVNTASDTIELRSAVAVNEKVAKTVQQLVDDFESCVTYLSESPDDDLSLPDVGDKPASGWPVRQPRTQEAEKPADPRIVEMVISELSAFLRIPAENLREESSLLSLGLDSLKAVALSHRLRERGISIQPIDIIRAGSVRGVSSASVRESEQESSGQDESSSELDQLLWQDLPLESVRLGRDDQIEITAATALQAGMLSQVIPTQTRGMYRVLTGFSLRPLPHLDNSMYTPSRSSYSNRAKSNY
jgi:aryl carrier-like protein